ncbi:MAG: PaaI family thioesterase [Betaproteobacteria bacterium]|nr:PaaI family thioesterase [Betaproteobacteria bacterium]
MAKVNETVAREAFEQAMATHKQDFGEFFLVRLYGMDIEYTDEECRISFDVKDFMHNPQGGLHGGVIAFVLDISMGHLLYRRSGPGATLEMKVQYLTVARSGRLTCIARFLRHGKRISCLRAELLDAKGEMVAYGTSTWTSIRAPRKTE